MRREKRRMADFRVSHFRALKGEGGRGCVDYIDLNIDIRVKEIPLL